ncbi:hypothetical protein J2R80_008337 [Bradyrhizobium sp. USDA 4541]|nr:hypothetical protein [Bradyrhizobium sp. USDA 4541]
MFSRPWRVPNSMITAEGCESLSFFHHLWPDSALQQPRESPSRRDIPAALSRLSCSDWLLHRRRGLASCGVTVHRDSNPQDARASELFGAGRNRRSETGWISFSRWSWRSGRIRKASEERLFIPGICPDFPKRLGKAPNLDPDVAYVCLAEARDSLARGQMRRGHDPGKSGAALIQHITETGKDSGSGAHVLAKPDF